MSRKLTKVMGVALALSLLSLLVVSSAFAASGATPQDAMTPNGPSATLGGQSSAWYAFQYSGDGSQITIQLHSQGAAGSAFTVWTPDQVAQMQAGNTVNPVGAGSPNADLSSDLSWSGNFNAAGTYYVQVQNNNGDPFTYTLSVTGSGVSTASAAPAASAAANPAPAPAATDGSSPAMAFPITGGSSTLQPGASAWFGFQYAGDQSQIQVLLNDQGQGGLAFSVWTPGEIAQMNAGNSPSAVGAGSPNADLHADYFWTGNFNANGTYYVQVTNTSSAPLSFTLAINGSGVAGLPAAAPAAAATTAPVATTTAAPAAANPAPVPAANGSGPDTALTFGGNGASVAANSSVWYKFNYAGDGSQITVIINDGGSGGTNMSVWTPDEIKQMNAGNSPSAVGGGSPNADANADLLWTGNFSQAGVYYVQFTNSNSFAVDYTATVTGSGVS